MMITMLWTDQYSVKVREIDDQHKRFIDMINLLYRTMSAGEVQGAPARVLREMAEYADQHFSTEERYMRQCNYPGTDEHLQEHKRFLDKVRTLREQAEQQGPVRTLEVLLYLKEWLNDHILRTDMKYTDHFARHGVR